MRSGHYTRLKGRTTYFRRKVPDSFRSRLASSEICVRLGVINRDSAERLGRRLAVAVDAFFHAAKRDQMLDSAALSKVVAQTIADWRMEDERRDAVASLGGGHEVSLSAREKATMYAELAQAILEGHHAGRGTHDAIFIEARFRAAGLALPDDSVDVHIAGRRVSLGLALHYLETAIAIAGRHGLASGWRALPVRHWESQSVRLKASLVETASNNHDLSNSSTLVKRAERELEIDRPVQAATSKSQATAPVALFSELFDSFINSQMDAGLLREGHRHGTQSSKRIWIEVCGDRPVSEYARQDFASFRATLLKVPKYYWKSDTERVKSILQIIDEAEERAKVDNRQRGYVRVGPVTINKHLSYIGPFFEWAKTQGIIASEPQPFWTGFHLPTGKKVTGLEEHEERPPFSDEQIARIFDHPVWTGRLSARVYNAPGSVVIRNSLYWCPLIAIYSLMRREEFCQLKVKHVRLEQGIWVFDLHHHEIELKNASSRRYVPLHRCLIELGFIEALIEGRDPEERLFVELSPSKSHGRFGDAVGSQFARVIDHQGIVVLRKDGKESEGVFHPLRHFGETRLLNANVPDGIVDEIAGHKSSAREREKPERGRYNKGYGVGTLKEAIDKLIAPIDVRKLRVLSASQDTQR